MGAVLFLKHCRTDDPRCPHFTFSSYSSCSCGQGYVMERLTPGLLNNLMRLGMHVKDVRLFLKPRVHAVRTLGLEDVTRVLKDVFLAAPLFISSLGN
eukprot:TRINITY_DN32497_c0_g1_i1.p2 TRINITY_DN32497_c0_g1~~TRINITY_DN32497_c0_g1_i1.p2  ORF type:complete len:105 (-),score=23.20 TRINITY_DN32497_c0_g1_i1:235-525(-)